MAGYREVAERDLDAALRERQIMVSSVSSKRRPFFLTPTLFGARELLVRNDIDPVRCPAAYRYVRYRAILEGNRDLAPHEADAAGVCFVLHLDGCCQGGAAWQAAEVRQLASVPGLWPNAPLREVLGCVDAVLSRMEIMRAGPSRSALARMAAMQAKARWEREGGNFSSALSTYRLMYRRGLRVGAWEMAARARLGAAATCIVTGAYPQALRHLLAARRVVCTHDLRALRGELLHEFFSLATEWRHPAKAERLAGCALQAYGAKHPRTPYLANDVAFFWRERGEYRRAAAVFAALLPKMTTGGDRLRVLGNLLWALGCCGDGANFERHWTEAVQLASDLEQTTEAAFGYLGMAWGLCGLGRFDNAIAAARSALQLASERGENRTRALAEVVLDKATRRLLVVPPPASGGRGDALAANLVRCLREDAVAA